ncbi:MAG: tetratricopeptide repeat protein [Sporomusaceae bacterium]|jgi:tetratricopeptide (TPR) repeat protein|nr:tetratricopeptide repeat protein [Sporomusaceae bacterium]
MIEMINTQLSAAQKFLANGQIDDAARLFLEILLQEPDNERIFNSLAVMTELVTDNGLAADIWQKLTKTYPANTNFAPQAAAVFKRRGQYQEAQTYLKKCLAKNPDDLPLLLELGSCQLSLHQYAEAEATYQQIIALPKKIKLSPDALAMAYANLASALCYQGKLAESIQADQTSLSLKNDPNVRRNIGVSQLLLGNLKAGFTGFEYRRKSKKYQPFYDHYDKGKKYWRGEGFRHKRLLVHHEQGLGDSIFMARYLPEVKKLGGTVIFSALKPLLPLYQNLTAVDELIEHDLDAKLATQYDLTVSILSLPHIFGTTLAAIPANIPYLAVSEELVAQWREKIACQNKGGKKLKVGLAWAGNSLFERDAIRSIALSMFAPLFELKGIDYYSLQIGPAANQTQNPSLKIFDLTPQIADFAATAAFLTNLDLIISVDTAVAHLAGALGKKTWTLLYFNNDWRWLTQRADTPWYPSMKLFRQPILGDWQSVIAAVKRELEKEC